MRIITPASILAALLASSLAGCAEPPAESHSCHALTAGLDDPNAMPQEIIDYLAAHHWSHMHLDFHIARLWDGLDRDTQDWASKQNIARWKLQEGEPTTGLEFLAMHRLMLAELRARFPQDVQYFAGWTTPPTDPNDPTGMLPADTRPFDPRIAGGIDRIEHHPETFTSDDDFALFLQTKRRPTPDNRKGWSSDPDAGAHNYLHVRFSSDSPINVGDPAVNLQNQVFWRIHGWLDNQWTAYRTAKALDDTTDPVYLQAMKDAQAWMDAAMSRAHALGDKADDACEQEPPAVKNIFAE